MPAADVLVVGGGIVGTAASLAAAEAGARVRLVDAGVNAGSDANAGSLHVQLQSRFIRLYPEEAPNVEASLPLYLAAVAEWERLERRHGRFGLVRRGGLMLAEGEAQLAFLAAKAAREAARGLAVEMLDRAALDRLMPGLAPQIAGAELCRDEGKLDPLAANALLRAAAAARGVVRTTGQVVALEPGGARTRAGEALRAGRIVVAAAWGAGPLLAGLGLRVPLRAEPLHMNITEPAASAFPFLVQHAERSITLKQFASGQVVIGGGWAARGRGEARVPGVLAGSLLGNVALAARLVPGLAGLRVIRTWAGINTTIDGKSAVGEVPGAPWVIAALPGDAGYTLGPLVGRLAAELALGMRPRVDLRPYAPGRFAG